MEKTLVILKPEVLERGLTSDIMDYYKDFNCIKTKIYQPTRWEMAQHYSDLIDKYSDEIIEGIIDRMTRDYCIFLIFEGNGIIEEIRKINGATDPEKADKNTIRGKWASKRPNSIQYNLVHASDSVASAEREISLWFS